MKLFSVNAGFFKLDGGAMFGVVPKSMWNKVNPADDANMCTWAMRCLLVDTGDRRILVDTGMGNKQDAKFFSHYYPHGTDSVAGGLSRHGYSMDDITDVFLTHLHFDHCGGAIKRDGDKLVPAFKNARYWSHRTHWASALDPNEREKASFLAENILPIEQSGQLHFFEGNDGDEWIPGIRVRIVNGHTEHMMLPLVKTDDKAILFCADLIPSAAHVSLPWVMAYDMRPLDTLSEKKRLLRQAAEENWILFLEHDPVNECCSLVQTEKGVRVDARFPLNALL